MRKKTLTTVLILTLILSCMPLGAGQAFAAQTPRIAISTAQAQPGDSVDLTIQIADNPGITSLDFSVQYDAAQFELVGKQNGSLLKGTINSQTLDKVPYYCGWINSLQTKNCTDNGTLITLTFRVKDSAINGKQAIAFTQNEVIAYDKDIKVVKFAAQNGYIEITNGKEPTKPDKPSGGSSGAGGGAEPGLPTTPTEPGKGDKQDPAATKPQQPDGAGVNDQAQGSKPAENDQQLTAKQQKTITKIEAMQATFKKAKYDKVKKRVTLRFGKSNKNYRVDGYQIYKSNKKSSGFKKAGTTSKTSWTDKKPGKKGTTCYYKVRGYRKIARKTYYTAWSEKRKLTVR